MRFIKPISLNYKSFILDVRSPEEYAHETLDLPHVYKNIDELDPMKFIQENNVRKEQTINILCNSGGQASKAAEMFEQAGFENVAVIIGGIVEAEYEGVKVVKH